jgi:hypothetical protein
VTVFNAAQRRRRRRAVLALVIVAAVTVLVVWGRDWIRTKTGPSPSSTAATSSAPAAVIRTPRFDAARAQLAALQIKSWDRAQDFKRYRFGQAWSDDVNVEFGHNGCDTRDDILRRDLANLVVRPGTCFAQSGTLHDPYTGTTIDFVRGPDTSDSVEIDHVVSLADAWYKGARLWEAQRRVDFANDPFAGGKPESELRQGLSRCRLVAAAQRGVSVRLRRATGERQDRLRPVGIEQGETGDSRGPGSLLERR